MAISKRAQREQTPQKPNAEAFAALLETHDPLVVARAYEQARTEWHRSGGNASPPGPQDIVQDRPEAVDLSPIGRLIKACRNATFKGDS